MTLLQLLVKMLYLGNALLQIHLLQVFLQMRTQTWAIDVGRPWRIL